VLGHPSNVIHDSEGHNSWIYTRRGFDRDGVRDVNHQVGAPEYQVTMDGMPYQVPPSAQNRTREPMDQALAERFDYRALPLAPTPEAPDQRQGALDPAQGATPFDRLGRAALAGDTDGTRGIGQQFLETGPGQSWLQEGRVFNLEQARLRDQAAALPPPTVDEPARQPAMGR
jgi:hypothetical protein